MRELFSGYFVPTQKEFDELWREATFGFDANVLLGLYRLSGETRQVFFDVLQKLGNRIFLPNQSAYEYLRNRLGAISARASFREGLKNDAQKFAQNLEARLQEQSLQKGKELLEVANQAARKIGEIVDAASTKEPDYLRSDDLLSKLADLFEGKTGPAYDTTRFSDTCKAAATRYLGKVPPGYKDDNKSEPDKYGDVLIWFQLIDHATQTNKPIVFVTRDAKEDWWLQHNGEIIGPRPELVHEMKASAGVRFYMYTMPRFLDYAQHFFNLGAELTKKAASEIEEIERQDRQAAAQQSPTGEYPLTQREGEISLLVSEGLTNSEIAKRLALSEQTVKNYLFRIYEKLGMSSRVELALHVHRAPQQFQCPTFFAPGQRCIRFEGHPGPHTTGPAPEAAVCKCPVCGKRFASLEEFDAHVPCLKL